MKRFFALVPGMLLALAASGGTAQLNLRGMVFKEGTLELTLRYPALKQGEKKITPAVRLDSAGAELKYSETCSARVQLEKEGVYSISFRGRNGLEPVMELFIPMVYAGKGRWNFDGKSELFPREKTSAPFLSGGHFSEFSIESQNGEKLSLKLPGYFQLQDNRHWGWSVFVLSATPVLKNNTVTLDWKTSVKDGKAKVQVDRFGQLADVDFPEKVRSEQELKEDLTAEKAYYASFKPPEFDPWGGLPGSGKKFGLKKTGFFHVEKTGKRYLLVTPDGNAFFQIGCCLVSRCDDYTYIKGRKSIYEWLPERKGIWKEAFLNDDVFSFYAANYIRKTGAPFHDASWQKEMIRRLRLWGFNSHGGFGRNYEENRKLKFADCPFLPVRGVAEYHRISEGGLLDPFDRHNISLMDKLFRQRLPSRAEDPSILGYFSECERSYNDIARHVLGGPDRPAKLEFIRMMKKKYGGIEAFNRIWKTSFPSFGAISGAMLKIQTDEAHRDAEEFQANFIDAYYKLIHDTFRRYDGNHLYLGERYLPAQTGYQTALRTAGRYVDVFSINYYADRFDGTWLAEAGKTARRPILLSEWSYGAPSQGQFGCVTRPTQEARGEAYSAYVEHAASNPYVVGVQWFTLVDQSVTGKFFMKYNGEAMNTGLLNVADRPYKELLAHASKSNYAVYDFMFGKKKPSAAKTRERSGRIYQIPRILPENKIDGLFHGWQERPGERISRSVVSHQASAEDYADFWAAWDQRFLYIFLKVNDSTPAENGKETGQLWNADAVELFLGSDLKAKGSLLFNDRQLVVGASSAPKYCWYNTSEHLKIDTALIRSGDGRSYTLELRLPWSTIGARPEIGSRYRFDIGVDFGHKNGKRINQIMWSGDSTNSYNRSGWGTIILAP